MTGIKTVGNKDLVRVSISPSKLDNDPAFYRDSVFKENYEAAKNIKASGDSYQAYFGIIKADVFATELNDFIKKIPR